MNTELKQIDEERNDLIHQTQELEALRKKEDNRNFSLEERNNLDEKLARIAELDEKRETVKRSFTVAALENAPNVERHEPHNSPRVNEEKQGWAFRGWALNHNGGEVTSHMRQAAYDLGISLDNPNFVYRGQSVGTSSEGGYLRTPSTLVGLERATKAYSGILNYCRTVPSANGNPSFWATVDDTAHGADAVNELGGSSTTLTTTAVAFGKIDMAYRKVGSGVFPVSNELLQDAEIPVEQLITDLLGERIGRQLNTDVTTGNFTNCKGFITEATNSGVTASSVSGFTVPNLIDTKNSVDPSYWDTSTCWYMNQTAYGVVEKMVDDNGRPLVSVDYQANNQIRYLLGFPICISTAMASPGASAKSVAFGSASKFVYRPVNNVQFHVLRELYALDDAVGFAAFMRYSSRLVQPAALKYMAHPSS